MKKSVEHLRMLIGQIKDICKKRGQYRCIGETERTLKYRVSEHIGYVNTKKILEPAGENFNLKGNSKSDMKVLVLEKVTSFDIGYRKERESHLINIFNTSCGGLNKKP